MSPLDFTINLYSASMSLVLEAIKGFENELSEYAASSTDVTKLKLLLNIGL